MKLFRNKSIQHLLLLIGGIAFLNLSFVLAEVKILSLDADNALIQNLAKFGFDEEKETDGESESETSEKEKEVDLTNSFDFQHAMLIESLSKKSNRHQFEDPVNDGFRLIFSPPPEFVNVSV